MVKIEKRVTVGINQRFIESSKNKFNAYNLEQIQLKNTFLMPTLRDHWLAGFTDAEGCFSISLSSTSSSTHVMFGISQKGEENLPVFSVILLLFGVGIIRPHHNKGCFEYRIASISGCFAVYTYFDSYSLKTLKKESYRLWKEVHTAIANKEHLNSEKRLLLCAKSKQINAFSKF